MSKPPPRKYPNQVLTSRPEGMSQKDYKAEQKKQQKIMNAYMRGERVLNNKNG